MSVIIVLAVIGFLFAIVIGYAVTLYNGLVVVKNNILKAWGNIDVLLKQRHDEIPKLVKTCEAYMKFEKTTLAEVISLRNGAASAQGIPAKAQKEGELSMALGRLFALAENYPNLKSESQFQHLQGRITDLENQIADRREFYNESVNTYNIRIESFPDGLIARQMGLNKQEMFKVSEEDKKDVEININVP